MSEFLTDEDVERLDQFFSPGLSSGMERFDEVGAIVAREVAKARREVLAEVETRIVERRDQFQRQTGASEGDYGVIVYRDALAAVQMYGLGHGIDLSAEATPHADEGES